MLKLDNLFQSGMILQRDVELNIWGRGDSNSLVVVNIQGKTYSTKSDDLGDFVVKVEKLKTSKCEDIVVTCNDDNIELSDVMVGEVWIASGQSNIEFHMRYEKHLKDELLSVPNESLRFYDVPKVCFEGHIDSFDYSKMGKWRSVTKEDLEYFSAVGYYFQKIISNEIDVPVGIIGCNWGGTSSPVWLKKETVERVGKPWWNTYTEQFNNIDMEKYFNEQRLVKFNDKGSPFSDVFSELVLPRTPDESEMREFYSNAPKPPEQVVSNIPPHTIPGCLFEYMVKPLSRFSFKGVLWYQGESDDVEGCREYYKDMLTALINDWREVFNNDKLPFYIVQIPGCERWLEYVMKDFMTIRKCQEEVTLSVNNTYLCSISDAGEQYDIHPKDKKIVGKRLADLALNYEYDVINNCEAPRLKTLTRSEKKIELEFDFTYNGLYALEGANDCLKVTANEELVPYKFDVKDTKISISLDQDYENVTVSFAWDTWFNVQIYNSADIPLIPFKVNC